MGDGEEEARDAAGDAGEAEDAGDAEAVAAPGRPSARTEGSVRESAAAGAGAGERTSKPVAKATVAENAERVTDLVIIPPR
ncbi:MULTISPECIES: hypothetical protein [unclassified Streptomyces]|uniref:hypothetical protein n=1 Tax=unclassified Streptomyces TaxID=2593676 RepID=UPI00081E07DC|nr:MULTISPECIES: hypothetical protein [unclassified Streptomyces]SCG07992.1 hypothetical protein GA0115259_112165 [Streptomyces sp. MnatMP-M17]